MGKGGTDHDSALATAARQGAPGPGRESMSAGIRNLIIAWTEGPDPRDDDERLAAIRRGPRFAARPVLVEPSDEEVTR